MKLFSEITEIFDFDQNNGSKSLFEKIMTLSDFNSNETVNKIIAEGKLLCDRDHIKGIEFCHSLTNLS